MKEIEIRKTDLTNKPKTPYSKGGPRFNRGGENFMAENNGEVQQPQKPQEGGQKPQEKVVIKGGLTPEAFEAKWEEYLQSREKQGDIPADEMQTLKLMRESGLPPIAGGADRLNLTDFSDPILQNIVRELNQEVERIGVGKALDPRFIRGQIERVRTLLDNRQVPPQEANNLLGSLNAWMAEALQEQEGAYRSINTQDTRLIRENDEERNRIFEEIFTGVDANPGVDYRTALSLEAMGRLDEFYRIINTARVLGGNGQSIPEDTRDPILRARLSKEREKLTREFSARREIRRILHDANWSVSGGGDIEAFVQGISTFASEYVDLIFQDPLVGNALHMFEQAFQQIKAENRGMLPYENLAWNFKTKSSNLEDRVWNLMRESIVVGEIPKDVPEWRLRRSIILARGFGVLSLRFPEIAAQARLPEETPLANATQKASRLSSIYGEALSRYLDPLEHIIEKFNLGGHERALLYFFLTGDKSHFQSKKQLEEALKMKSHFKPKDKRMVDIINLFRIGGPFSYSSWRAFVAMEGMTPEQIRRAGIGIREARASGDVEDQVRNAVRVDVNWKNLEPEEVAKEIDAILKMKERDLEGILYGKAGDTREDLLRKIFHGGRMPREDLLRKILEIKGETVKEKLVRQERLRMWMDALKANPLRIMWEWENKESGKRRQFLSKALRITETQAEKLLPQIEQDLMVIQENTIRCLNLPKGDPNRVTFRDREMLKYEIIGGHNPTPKDLARRLRVRLYVEKIRQKAKEDNYSFFNNLLFEKINAEGSPFPFVVGMEDIPFADFNFIKAGGAAFARRIKDFAASTQATNELIGLILKVPTTHDIGPLIESLAKIKEAVSNYDRTLAMEILPFIEEGIIRMYDKDIMARLPLGIGTITSLLSDTSFVQTEFGREAMSWDEGDKFNFTRHLMQNHLTEKEDIAKIRKRVGATHLNLGVAVLRTYGQLVLLLLAYEFAKMQVSEK